MSQTPHDSKSAVPTAIVLGIVAISVALFFVFTLPYFKNRGVTAPEADPAAAKADTAAGARSSRVPDSHAGGSPAPGATPAPERTAPAVPAATPAAPSAPAANAAAKRDFTKSADLIAAIAATFEGGDTARALEIVGEGRVDASVLDRFKTLVGQGRFELAGSEPFVEIGRLNSSVRYAVNLDRPESGGLPAERKQILIDVSLSGGRTWNVTGLHVPTFSALASVAKAESPSAPTTPDRGTGAAPRPMVVEGAASPPDDPLTLAHEFIDAVINQDFAKAKSLVDSESVTEEKLAGLFIVTEEGRFKRKEKNALIATEARDNAAWVVAQMANEETGADFGLEIGRAKDGSGEWRISALNLDRLLKARAGMTDADDVTYTPIVENPRGGDSLVLYFAYDDGALHSRSVRQLEIVAAILKADPGKMIMIAGHADAKGPDEYNQILSNRRAAAVRRGLLNAGVSASQIETRSFGESEPISPNVRPDGSDNPDGRKRNRRAEVYLNF